MQVNFFACGRALGAKLTGELDHHSAPKVRQCIDQRIMKGSNNLILDLTELSFMDSSGLGVILGRYKLVTQCGGNMQIVVGGNKAIKKLLCLGGIEKIIKIKE